MHYVHCTYPWIEFASTTRTRAIRKTLIRYLSGKYEMRGYTNIELCTNLFNVCSLCPFDPNDGSTCIPLFPFIFYYYLLGIPLLILFVDLCSLAPFDPKRHRLTPILPPFLHSSFCPFANQAKLFISTF